MLLSTEMQRDSFSRCLGSERDKKQERNAREIRKALGDETEMRDGDLKIRLRGMKGWINTEREKDEEIGAF